MSDLGKLLAFDPLAEAEKLTGHSYKDDRLTSDIGFGLHMLHNERKNAALIAADDSHYGITFAEMVDLMERLGFEVVLTRPFTDGKGREERFLILWHPSGILGYLESYTGDQLNSAKVYYAVKPHDKYLPWEIRSSGQLRDGVWIGDHDAREGIRYNLAQLREHGDFLNPWPARPFLWLLTYMESKGDYDYEAINKAVIAELPEHVRTAITPEARS